MGFLVQPVSWFHIYRCFKGFVVSWYGLLGFVNVMDNLVNEPLPAASISKDNARG